MPWRDRLLAPRTEFDEPFLPPVAVAALGQRLRAAVPMADPNQRIDAVLAGLAAVFEDPTPDQGTLPMSAVSAYADLDAAFEEATRLSDDPAAPLEASEAAVFKLFHLMATDLRRTALATEALLAAQTRRHEDRVQAIDALRQMRDRTPLNADLLTGG